MADMFITALITLLVIAALHVKNPAFVPLDSIGLSIERKELVSG